MNLWNETIAVLKSNGKTFDDVLTICGNEFQITKDDFKKYANTEYNAGYGDPEVAEDLLVIGTDFWLERHEYDGSEWWEFKQMPQCKGLPFKTITSLTVQQHNKNSDDCYCGVENIIRVTVKRGGKMSKKKYIDYGEILEERFRLGLDEMSRISKVNAFNHFIDTMPSADVEEVRHGKWINDGDCFHCSVCNKAFGFLSEKCVSNFCPNCGAKMDKE